jgi:peptidoglycan/LPS O-acetylase OafA/YrhL
MPFRDSPVPLLSLLDMGHFGVCLFFALSGCTLFLSNANKLKDLPNISGFYIRRFFRIWPAYFVSLLIYAAFAPVFRHIFGPIIGNWFGKQFYTEYSFLDFMNYVLLIFNVTGPELVFNNSYWTLPIEFQYYLLFPLLVLSFRRLSIFGPILISLILWSIPSFISLTMKPELFDMAFIFCGGALIGYMLPKISIRLENKYGIGLFMLLMAFAVVIRHSYADPLLVSGNKEKWAWEGAYALLVVFSLLVSKISLPPRVESFLNTYGEISYSTYLLHGLFLSIAALIVKDIDALHGPLASIWFCLLFTLIGTYIGATLSYKFVEVPANKYGRTLAAALTRK